MSKRKQKNRMTTISLLVVLVLLSGFYIWYMNKDAFLSKDTEEDAGLDNNEIVATMDSELIDKIHFKNDNADMTLVLEDDKWVSVDNKMRPIRQNNVQNMIRLVSVVRPTKIVDEQPEDLEQYGLSSPYAYIEAYQSDGKSIALSVGNRLANGQGYYAMVEGNDAVYVLPLVYGNDLSYSDLNMTDVDHGPTIPTSDIYHIQVLREEGEDFELIYDPDSSYIDIPLITWAILKPYDEIYGADNSKVSEILTNYNSFRFDNCIEYQTDDIAKYGLEEPRASILVGYNENNPGEGIIQKSFKLHVGTQDDNGDYYVMKDGDKAVYTMKAFNVERMLDIDAFSVLSTFVSLHNISSVDKIDINIEGKSYIMEIKRKTITNDEGEEEIESTYYFDGLVTTERAFKDLYQLLAAAKIDSQLQQVETVDGKEPVLTISYHIIESDQPIVSKYYVYDDVFYLIDNGGPIRFVADRRRIDKIINAVKDFEVE